MNKYLCFLLLMSFGFSAFGHDQKMPRSEKSVSIYLDAVDVSIGPKFGIGQCPCFRIAIQTKLLSGQIETEYLLIKSEGLLTMAMDRGLNFRTQDSLTKQLFNLGASEIMWKEQVLGLHFPGVTFGNDLDRSYNEIIRTGIHLLVKAHMSQYSQVDFRIGYDYEEGKVNLFRDFQSHMLHSSFHAVIKKGRQRFSFDMVYQLIPDFYLADATKYSRTTIDITYSVDIIKTNYFDMYLGVNLHGEVDKIRGNRDALAPYNVSMQLLLGGRFVSKKVNKKSIQ